jgi:hypothetical protein
MRFIAFIVFSPNRGTLTAALLRRGYGLQGRGQVRPGRFAGRGARNKSIVSRFPQPPLTNIGGFAIVGWRRAFQPGAKEIVMAKGQMRSNKEKKKPKADKNLKKGGATPSPFSSGKTPAGQSPNSKKS